MNIIQVDEVEMPLANQNGRIGLLVNVHLSSVPSDEEMNNAAKSLIAQKNHSRFGSLAVVFWLQNPKKVRIKCVEHWN